MIPSDIAHPSSFKLLFNCFKLLFDCSDWLFLRVWWIYSCKPIHSRGPSLPKITFLRIFPLKKNSHGLNPCKLTLHLWSWLQNRKCKVNVHELKNWKQNSLMCAVRKWQKIRVVIKRDDRSKKSYKSKEMRDEKWELLLPRSLDAHWPCVSPSQGESLR